MGTRIASLEAIIVSAPRVTPPYGTISASGQPYGSSLAPNSVTLGSWNVNKLSAFEG